MNKKNILLLNLLFIVANCTFAQVRVYEKGQQGVAQSVKKQSNVWKFKIDPIEASIAGTAKIYVERTFGDVFALEFGGGVTYNSLMNSLMFSANEDLSGKNDLIFGSVKNFDPPAANQYFSQLTDKNAKLGYSFSLMPKVYTDEDPLDGFYLGLLLDYKNYAYDFIYQNKQLPYNLTKLNIFLMMGTTHEFGSNFFVESQIGFGPSIVNDHRYITYLNQATSTTYLGRAIMKDFRFGLCAGVRFGIYFD